MRTTLKPNADSQIDSEEKECQYCGKPFFSNNPRSIYCGDSCKSKSYQARKQSEGNVDGIEHLAVVAASPIKDNNSSKINEPVSIESETEELKEQLRMSEARNRVSDNDYFLLVGILADKWFLRIFQGEPLILTMKEIVKNCRPLADALVNDVGECDVTENGFTTSNFTLRYICQSNDDAYYINGEENEVNYQLKKTNK